MSEWRCRQPGAELSADECDVLSEALKDPAEAAAYITNHPRQGFEYADNSPDADGFFMDAARTVAAAFLAEQPNGITIVIRDNPATGIPSYDAHYSPGLPLDANGQPSGLTPAQTLSEKVRQLITAELTEMGKHRDGGRARK